MVVFISIAVVVVAALILLLWRRGVPVSDALDLGVVSTRWLSDIRRDEPRTRS